MLTRVRAVFLFGLLAAWAGGAAAQPIGDGGEWTDESPMTETLSGSAMTSSNTLEAVARAGTIRGRVTDAATGGPLAVV
jgi:hypothetical protein